MNNFTFLVIPFNPYRVDVSHDTLPRVSPVAIHIQPLRGYVCVNSVLNVNFKQHSAHFGYCDSSSKLKSTH
jgi:hypothetical protein